jgi:hypothetical protein
VSEHDPASAPRQRESGYKGDAWTVTIPAEGVEPILLLDTGLDSVAIVRIPDGAWDRGNGPLAVHAHDRYDETVLIPGGSGIDRHGPDAAHIASARFEGPVTIVFPAGTWHHIVMDPGAAATGTAFFTVAGTVIEPFSVQMDIVTRARASFAAMPVVHPRPVQALEWTQPLAPRGPTTATLVEEATAAAGSTARILPYPPLRDGLLLALDTGRDSLFILATPPSAAPPDTSPPGPVSPPEFVDVHRHPDVDEYIIRPQGAGYILNGREPETITLTPYRGPCVMVMPAGAFHRIVHTEEERGTGSILIYADRRAVVERYETIMARTAVAALAPAVESAPA